MGRYIREALDGRGILYRLTGADFAILSAELDEDGMSALYETVRKLLHSAIEVNGTAHRLLVFGGLLLRSPTPELSEKEVYDYLKAACGDSEHKLHGALVSFHEAGAKEPVEQQITREIRRCMTKEFENFYLRYQPIYDRAGGWPIAVEALLRWKNPQYGELTPIRFLADIEPHLSCRRLRQGHRERGRGKRALRPAGSRRTGSVLRRLRVLRRGAGSVGSPAELTKMKGTACAVPFVVYFSGASQSVP